MAAIAAAVLAALLAIAAVAGVLVTRGRLAEQRQAAVVASADAVRATAVDPFLDRLRRVRTVTFESLDAAQSSRMAVMTVIRQEREQQAERERRAAARRAAAAAAGDTTGSPATGGQSGPTAAAPRPSGGLVIGDSVSLGAESCLGPLGYRVDSAVGRQFTTGLDHLRVHASDGLPRSVVIHLGTNGPFTSSGFSEAMALTGDQRRVVWVTIALPPRSQYSFVDSLNDMIRSQAAAYDNVEVADFARAAAQHPEWMAGDGIHINGAGCAGFTQIVDAAVTRP